ncbi:hypothetical protein [Rhodococcus qingshengii]|uniref:hypothetical protein n=1 Tax=Rhodococcus qingshengii TaxID=334542 RepID=UPI002F9149C4
MTVTDFPPGTLINARGRDWLVLPGASEGTILARPLGGRDDETTVLLPQFDNPKAAVFDAPRSRTEVTPPAPGYSGMLYDSPSAPPRARSDRSPSWPSPPATTSSCL